MVSYLLKKSVPRPHVYVLLIVVFLFYIIMNNVVFNWMMSSPSSAAGSVGSASDRDNKFRPSESLLAKEFNGLPNQILLIKKRIEELEKELDKSKKDAIELKILMKSFQSLTLNISASNSNSDDINNNNNNTNSPNSKGNQIAVLVFSCNRPSAIENHLKQLIEKRRAAKHSERMSIIVSQDCNHLPTQQMIMKYREHLFAILKQPDQSEILVDGKGTHIPDHMRGYYKISRHYKWALEQIFMTHAFQSVIVTEDDLNVSDDFFDYFDAMHGVLQRDPTLFCVSAWNDNGKSNLIDMSRNELVHRSDFFPGLGWMMMRSLWIELRKKWPAAFWDDWIRDRAQRKERACLRPEISRTQMSIEDAKNGVSRGQFFDDFLIHIVLNKRSVNWFEKDNSNLIKAEYDEKFLEDVYNKSTELKLNEYLKLQSEQKAPVSLADNYQPILLTYNTKEEFIEKAKYFGIMDDFKNGVPRTAYMGIVQVWINNRQIYIAPRSQRAWSGYNPSW